MRYLFLVLLLSGCTGMRGNPQHIICYSSGKIVYEGDSTVRILVYDGGRFFFRDKKTGNIVDIFASCIITEKVEAVSATESTH